MLDISSAERKWLLVEADVFVREEDYVTNALKNVCIGGYNRLGLFQFLVISISVFE